VVGGGDRSNAGSTTDGGGIRIAPEAPRARRVRRTRVGGAVVAVVLVVGVAGTVFLRTEHAGGDPGGRVLTALGPVTRAVPPGSGVVSDTRHDAVWSAACPDNPTGRSGWSGVEVDEVFTTTRSSASVVAAVGAALAAQGWRPTFAADDAAWQYTPVAEWTKPVAGTTSARVVVFAYPASASPATTPGGTTWLLGAEGKTPGYALAGC
jgi:hypothetical protein